jgi:hypothetical protein
MRQPVSVLKEPWSSNWPGETGLTGSILYADADNSEALPIIPLADIQLKEHDRLFVLPVMTLYLK